MSLLHHLRKISKKNNSNNTSKDIATSQTRECTISTVKWIDHNNYHLIPSNLDPETDPSVIKVLCISDTHNKHLRLSEMPSADILIHAGDFTMTGCLNRIKNYDRWIGKLLSAKKYKHAILIAGNHDITFEKSYYNNVGYKRFHNGQKQSVKQCRSAIKNSIYLEDKAVEICGLKIYGSPYQPEFCNWAFNVERGPKLKKIWSKIPADTDILITHGPPLLHGDMVGDENVGCYDLMKRVSEIKNIKYHVFGHIHEGYGATTEEELETVFINASSVNLRYHVVNKPVMFYIQSKDARKVSKNDMNNNNNKGNEMNSNQGSNLKDGMNEQKYDQ